MLCIMFWYVGFLFSVKLKKYSNVEIPYLLLGFIATIALFQLVSVPFLLARPSSYYLFYSFIIIFLTLLILFTKQQKINPRKLKLEIFKKNQLTIFIFSFIILSIVAVFANKYDIDDSYYLGISSSSVVGESIYSQDPSTGITEYSIIPFYRIQSWELFIGFVSFVSKLSPSIVAHTVFLPLIVWLFLLAFRRLASKILISKQNSQEVNMLVLFFSISVIFSGVSTMSLSTFAISRSWQGKAIVAAVLLPLIISLIIDYFAIKNKRQIVLMLIIAEIAMLSLSSAAIPLSLALLVGIALIATSERRIDSRLLKDLAYISSPILVSSIALKVFVNTADYLDMSGIISSINFDAWTHTVLTFFGSKQYLILFSGSLAFLVLQRSYILAKKFAIYLLLVALVILNPIWADFIGEYITSSLTYWRLFWILQPEFIIALAFWIFLTITWRRGFYSRAISVFVLGVIFTLLTSSHFNKKNGYAYQIPNIYRVPESVIEVSNLPEGSLVLGDESINVYARSVNPRLKIAYSRDSYMQHDLRGHAQKLLDFQYLASEAGGFVCRDEFVAKSQKYDIEYVVLDMENKCTIRKMQNSSVYSQIKTRPVYIFKLKD